MDEPSAPTLDALLPAGMARKAEAIGEAKAALGAAKLLVLSVLAGAFIAFGAVFSTVATSSGSSGPMRVLGGLTFSLGLVLVVIGGAELFTGNNLIVMAWAGRRVTLRQLLRNWVIVYVGNLVGAMSVSFAVVVSGHAESGGGAIGRRALDIAAAKSTLGFGRAVVLGVLANVLVCLAVWLTFSARTVIDKIAAIVLPVTAFVAAGFEHSIANMYFLPTGILLRAWAPDRFWATIGATPSDYSAVDWHGFVSNLVPVTIGNVIGGAGLVGLVYWFVYLRDAA